jgi:hypothetical protein
MQPTVGRIVHTGDMETTATEARPLAAIITRVWSDTCINLCVFTDAGPEMRTSVVLAAEGDKLTPVTWTWPPRA